MDSNLALLTNLLTSKGFVRTNRPLSKPLVVHAVAGAGKSTVIREFLQEVFNSSGQTLGIPDPPTLEGAYIKAATVPLSNHFNILDEYSVQPLRHSWDAVFSDPLQNPAHPVRPHFICTVSHRLGPEVCDLLRDLGISISSSGSRSQTVFRGGVFESELKGTLIALDEEIRDLLTAHALNPVCPHEVLGRELPVVTVLSSQPIPNIKDRSGLYIALTRATDELRILAPGF